MTPSTCSLLKGVWLGFANIIYCLQRRALEETKNVLPSLKNKIEDAVAMLESLLVSLVHIRNLNRIANTKC